MSRIVVFGSINIDESTHVDHIPVTGETVVALGEQRRRLGGKGANQAIAARVLESEVTLVGAVGSDEAGDWAAAQLRDYRIDLGQVRVADAPSGRATILITAGGDNAIVVASGANAQVTVPEALGEIVADAGALLVQFELPLSAVALALRTASERGLLTVTNAAPMADTWTDDLAEALRHSRILIVNEIEAAQLAALAGLATDDVRAVGQLLRGLGPDTVIITRGAEGIVASSLRGELTVDAFAVDVVDTTGAGDACCAAITVALLRGANLATAIATGNAAGAHSVARPGTAESFGRMEDLESMMQQVEAPR